MSEMEVTESGNDCSNDLLLLDRVFLRLGNADSDDQLESCLNRFLPPVILKLSSPHEQVRTKVMELLVHVNKRVKCRADVQLPVQTLLQLYKEPTSNSFIINFSIIYITMGFPRLPREQQLSLAPSLLQAIENKPQGHQDGILMLVMPLLGDIKETDLNLKEKPKVANLILKFATDVLLLPYSEFQVPPGMSMKTYKRIIDKNQLNPNQLEEMKLSIVNFIGKDIFNMNDTLLTLIVAAADSRFSVANHANSPLIRVNSSVDWSSPSVVAPLYSLYLGTWGGMKVPPDDRKVVFSSLFDPNTNSRLRNQALVFLLNVINSGDEVQLKKVATVFLQGLLKLIRSDEHAEQHPKAYMCLGRLAMKCPDTINNQFALLEELVKKIPDAVPEMKTALRDALLEMSAGFKINTEAKADTPSSSSAGTSQGDKMEVDDSSKTSPFDEPQAQDDISTEALKCLYGTSRPSEIEDAVFNVSKKETAVVNIDEDGSKKDKDRADENQELKVPKFSEVVNYVWDQMQKRKKGSNSKHRFVIGNQVLQFHPLTYQEILRYMRMCLNRDAALKDCSNHPNATSPLLAKYFYDNLLDTEVLERYLTMITSLLNASPEIMPLSCFLDIIGCVPEKMAAKYTSLLPFLRNLFTSSTKEDIRDISAVIYAIITVHTSEKSAIDKEIKEFVSQGQNNKNLEAQCGYLAAFSSLCERCIVLSKRAKFGGKGFNSANWEPYQEGAVVLANFLASSQTLLVSTSCSAISLLARCSGLPLPTSSTKQDALLQGENPFNINKSDTNVDDNDVTKFTVADRLFKVVGNAKLPSKLKERALYTLGLLCCGERLPFAKQIVMGFLQMAKDSKEFEIHLQIGESLVLCVEGVNSNENRDLWTELPKEGAAKIKNTDALKENDELLEWLLQELFKIGRHPHPHSRQATSIWLLALLKNCADRAPIKNKLPILQDVFMDFLSENSDIVQDVASKGLSLVYQNSDESQKQALVGQIIEQLTSGKRSVAQVTEDTKIFEEGQLGKAPTGGNLSTYKELCSLASDLNQPDLLYKFMHLAHHNSMWNSKKALQAGAQLSQHLPKIVPRLYRYRGAQSLHQSLHQLPTIWSQLFRVMDDVHEGTRQAATSTANVLSKLCIRAADANAGKDGKEVVLQTVSKLVTAAGETLKPFLARLIPALAGAAGELESARLSYLATALADTSSRDLLDDMRASAARHHYTTDTVVKIQDDSGDMHGISQQVVNKICKNIAEALAKKAHLYINMPNSLEYQQDVIRGFRNLSNFPTVIGAIDCTHIRIKKVGGDMSEVYVNRKGYYSINTQVVCDSKLNLEILWHDGGEAYMILEYSTRVY
ncbi:hypothetical protein HF086_015234 [Spodoptera exigua]|uniref:Uncharacterized protein n=1 Tax=Spodoptera exigua TaxID=7107 RepID=A0A922M871_SPOEX|nr:hypothetical protein HF086_015234 [Spodoptera exigua]